jgi:hypothetical protein
MEWQIRMPTVKIIGPYRFFFFSNEGNELPHMTRKKWEIIGDGVGIHWPLIDEDLSIAGLLRGTAAPTDLPAARVHYGLQRTAPRRTRKQSR